MVRCEVECSYMVELDLEITAGSYNAKVNLQVCFN